MIKTCEECGGLGYYQFDTSDVREDELPMYIDLCCDNCQGEGFYKTKSILLAVIIYKKPIKRILLDIQESINRPNNPEIFEIVDAYIKYNYGNVEYDYFELEETDEITEEWNIENYR